MTNTFDHVAVLGTGVIGASWASLLWLRPRLLPHDVDTPCGSGLAFKSRTRNAFK